MAIWIDEYNCDINDDEIGFLICVSNHNTGAEHYRLDGRPAHTNCSHEPRLSGWCGTTDNRHVEACGLARVTRRTQNQRCCLARVEPTAEVLEGLGYPDLMPEM